MNKPINTLSIYLCIKEQNNNTVDIDHRFKMANTWVLYRIIILQLIDIYILNKTIHRYSLANNKKQIKNFINLYLLAHEQKTMR